TARLVDRCKSIFVKEIGGEPELTVGREPRPPQGEFHCIVSRAQERGALEGSREKEMYKGTSASSSELNFKRGNSGTGGFERRKQIRASCRRGRERVEPNEAGLVEFHRDNVTVRRKPRCLRFKRDKRVFAEFLKPCKRLVHRDGRFPTHKEGRGGRKPRRPIRLLGRINGGFNSQFLHAVPIRIDGIGIAVPSARGNTEARWIFSAEEHHSLHLRPRRMSHQPQGLCMGPLRGRLLLPEIVSAGEWRQSKKRQAHYCENRCICRL